MRLYSHTELYKEISWNIPLSRQAFILEILTVPGGVLTVPGGVLTVPGEYLRYQGEYLRYQGEYLRYQGEYLRYQGEYLRYQGEYLRYQGEYLRYQGSTYGTRGSTYGTRGSTYGTRGSTYGTRGSTYGTRGSTYGTRGVLTVPGGVLTVPGGVLTVPGGVLTIPGGVYFRFLQNTLHTDGTTDTVACLFLTVNLTVILSPCFNIVVVGTKCSLKSSSAKTKLQNSYLPVLGVLHDVVTDLLRWKTKRTNLWRQRRSCWGFSSYGTEDDDLHIIRVKLWRHIE